MHQGLRTRLLKSIMTVNTEQIRITGKAKITCCCPHSNTIAGTDALSL